MLHLETLHAFVLHCNENMCRRVHVYAGSNDIYIDISVTSEPPVTNQSVFMVSFILYCSQCKQKHCKTITGFLSMKRYGIDLHIIGPLCGEFTAVLEKLLNKQSKYLWF